MMFLVATLFLLASYSEATEPRVVCYYTNWSVYRPGVGKYPTRNIDPNLCTHLNYAFGSFTKDSQIRPSDSYQDIDMGGYSTFTGLKSVNPKLKTLLTLGGTAEGSSTFSYVVSDAERRGQLVSNVIKFLRDNNFDGLDLDWGQPGMGRGSRPDDKANYVLLVKDLREGFDADTSGKSPLLLSLTVHRNKEFIEKGYDIAEINKYVDYMNVRGYDYHSILEPEVNHHAPLFASQATHDEVDNLNYTINYLINSGADRSKLVLGIPTYGRTFTLADPEKSTIGSPANGPGERGKATGERGYFSYYEICGNIKDEPGWTVVRPDPTAVGPYAVRENQWVGYDDIGSVQMKATYAAREGLGGIMFWTIDNDDFQGTCHGKSYPLINAGKEALLINQS